MLRYWTFIGIILFLTTFILIKGLGYDAKQLQTFLQFKVNKTRLIHFINAKFNGILYFFQIEFVGLPEAGVFPIGTNKLVR